MTKSELPTLSRTERGGPREQVVGLGERRYRSQPIEQCSGLVENRRSLVRLAEADEAAAVALESEGMFGAHPEPFPAPGGVGVAVRGRLVVAAVFGDGSVACDQRVVRVRSARTGSALPFTVAGSSSR